MLRTAEEILKAKMVCGNEEEFRLFPEHGINYFDGKATTVISAINEARKEAIEECAKLAENQIEEKGEMWDSAWRVHGAITELLKEVK